MGHSYEDGWNTKPKLDEARALAPEVPKTRSRKDRRRWCRGKVGIEHQTTLVMNKWALYFRAKHDADSYRWHAYCGWYEKGHWVRVKGQRHNDWVGNGEWYYSCKHDHRCKNCGKILGRLEDKVQCPDYAQR